VGGGLFEGRKYVLLLEGESLIGREEKKRGLDGHKEGNYISLGNRRDLPLKEEGEH